jgi:hypothetical protein
MKMRPLRGHLRKRLPSGEISGFPDMAAGLSLSIVVIPLIGRDILANCLDRLPIANVECIVVLREAMGTASSWKQRYPVVTFLTAPRDPVPLRRQYGLRAAGGEIVGLIEDTSWPHQDWCAAARSAFADRQTAAAGGPVAIAATLPSRYRALGASEYGAFAPDRPPPLARGVPQDRPIAALRVPGNNMAFRRADLIEALGEDAGLFEGPICARLLANGRQIVYQPRMRVTYAACDRHNAALTTRLHHGRLYVAARVQGRAWPARLALLAKTPLLPIVLTARAMRSVSGPVGFKSKLMILFWLAVMESAWALGEALGALTGAGGSLEEWR